MKLLLFRYWPIVKYSTPTFDNMRIWVICIMFFTVPRRRVGDTTPDINNKMFGWMRGNIDVWSELHEIASVFPIGKSNQKDEVGIAYIPKNEILWNVRKTVCCCLSQIHRTFLIVTSLWNRNGYTCTCLSPKIS